MKRLPRGVEWLGKKHDSLRREDPGERLPEIKKSAAGFERAASERGDLRTGKVKSTRKTEPRECQPMLHKYAARAQST
jgi:hypothetical protein